MRFRVVVSRDLWHKAYSELSVGNQRLAWGQIQRSYHDGQCDLLVRRLWFTRSVPSGESQSPAFDWILLDSPLNTDPGQARRIIEQSHLRTGQLLAYMQVGLGENRDQWIGAISHLGNMEPIQKLLFVGPEMESFSRSTSLKTEQSIPAKWSRVAGGMGHSVLRKFRRQLPMVVGTGRIGSLVAESLVRMGVRRIILVDPDQIEAFNLDATFGTCHGDIGRSKVGAIARHLNRIRPGSLIHALEKDISDKSVIDQARRCDLLISCVDNDAPRRSTAILANQLLKVHLDIGTIVRAFNDSNSEPSENSPREIAADVRLLLPRSCVMCVGGLREPSGITTSKTSDTTLSSLGQRLEPVDMWRSGGRLGSLLSINEIAVGSALQMWLDLLAGQVRQSMWQRIRWESGRGLSVASGSVAGRKDCPICGIRAVS